MGAYVGVPLPVNLSGQGDPLRLDVGRSTPTCSRRLEVRPPAGRGFTADDDAPGRPERRGSQSSSSRSRYSAGASNAVGRTVRARQPALHRCIGVMAPGFAFPNRDARLWQPLGAFPPRPWQSRTNQMLGVIGRLRPDVSMERARADLRCDRQATRARVPERERRRRSADP